MPSEEILHVAKKQWAKGLNGIPSTAILRAADEATTTLDWPPSLSEFIKLCQRPTEAKNLPVWNGMCLPETVSTPESKQEAEIARQKYRQILGLKR